MTVDVGITHYNTVNLQIDNVSGEYIPSIFSFKMEVICSEMLISMYKSIGHHNLEDQCQHLHHHVNLRFLNEGGCSRLYKCKLSCIFCLLVFLGAV